MTDIVANASSLFEIIDKQGDDDLDDLDDDVLQQGEKEVDEKLLARRELLRKGNLELIEKLGIAEHLGLCFPTPTMKDKSADETAGTEKITDQKSSVDHASLAVLLQGRCNAGRRRLVFNSLHNGSDASEMRRR